MRTCDDELARTSLSCAHGCEGLQRSSPTSPLVESDDAIVMGPWWTVEFDPGHETQWYPAGPRPVDEQGAFVAVVERSVGASELGGRGDDARNGHRPHGPSQAAACDRIVVMEPGRIVELGTHDELVAAESRLREVVGRVERRPGVSPGGQSPTGPRPQRASAADLR